MKKIQFILAFLAIGMIANAQTQTIYSQLKLNTVNNGTASDSLVLVQGTDKIIRKIPLSSIAGGGDLQQTLDLGKTAVIDSVGLEITTLPKKDPFNSFMDTDGSTYEESETTYNNTKLSQKSDNFDIRIYDNYNYLYIETPDTINNNEVNSEYYLQSNKNGLRVGRKLLDYEHTTSTTNYTDESWLDIRYDGAMQRYDGTTSSYYNYSFPNYGGDVALTSNSGLKAFIELSEGFGNGVVRWGRNPLYFGSIGNGAIDFSISNGASETRGATGTASFATGQNTTASGTYSSAYGSSTTAGGYSSFAANHANTISSFANYAAAFGSTNEITGGNGNFVTGIFNSISGSYGFAAGMGNISGSLNEFVVGAYATESTVNSPSAYSSSDRAFAVGVGTGLGVERKSGLEVWKNGVVIAPELTTSDITSADSKVLVTKEWVSDIYQPKIGTTEPTGPTYTGEVGEIRITAAYIYVCVATNTWVRAALATW